MYISLMRKSWDRDWEIGDFKAHEGEKCFDTLLYQHELKSLNKKGTSLKEPKQV